MAEQFEGFYIGHVPRLDNTHAYALAGLATALCLQMGKSQSIMVFARSLFHPKWTVPKKPTEANTSSLLQGAPDVATSPQPLGWLIPFIEYIMYNIGADDSKLAASVQKKAARL